MKRIGILAALALAPILIVGIGGTAQAHCIPTNCAINERQRAATSAQGATATEGATTPQLTPDATLALPGSKDVLERPVLATQREGSRCSKTSTTWRARRGSNPRPPDSKKYDFLEFSNEQKVLLNDLLVGQEATVIQLPPQPITAVQTKGQKRIRPVR
jgi:hypothetical protein